MKKTTVDDQGQIKEEYGDWEENRASVISRLNECKSRDDIDTWMGEIFVSILGNVRPEARLKLFIYGLERLKEFEDNE